MRRWCLLLLAVAALPALWSSVVTTKQGSFQFELLGDRTGEAQPGVYEEAWREAAADHPAFVLTVGDTIQGGNDETARAEWAAAGQILRPYLKIPLYLTPGNHDIWSDFSEKVFRERAHHPPHYSFDYEQAHFTVLDNSRSEEFSSEEMLFLERDLAAHGTQPLKFVVSHRPSWIFDAMMHDPDFAMQRIARKYGVRFVIAGHVHQLLHATVNGVEYLCVASSGGHLRASKKYEDGWFFQHTLVTVSGENVDFEIHELRPPFGQGRVTHLRDWGTGGLGSTPQ